MEEEAGEEGEGGAGPARGLGEGPDLPGLAAHPLQWPLRGLKCQDEGGAEEPGLSKAVTALFPATLHTPDGEATLCNCFPVTAGTEKSCFPSSQLFVFMALSDVRNTNGSNPYLPVPPSLSAAPLPVGTWGRRVLW